VHRVVDHRRVIGKCNLVVKGSEAGWNDRNTKQDTAFSLYPIHPIARIGKSRFCPPKHSKYNSYKTKNSISNRSEVLIFSMWFL